MKRQTCAHCMRTVGTLPSGITYLYETIEHDNGRRFHYCIAIAACEHRRSITSFGATASRPNRISPSPLRDTL